MGRETTGVTRAVRAALPAICKLREAQVTWAAIAEAMTRQGIRQRNGEALTASRLTSIVGQVEEQSRRKAALGAARRDRSDLIGARPQQQTEAVQPRLTADHAPSPGAGPEIRSEEDLRRSGLAELHQLLRKD